MVNGYPLETFDSFLELSRSFLYMRNITQTSNFVTNFITTSYLNNIIILFYSAHISPFFSNAWKILEIIY